MKIDDIEIEVRRSNRRSLAIEVTKDAKVIVRAPLLLPVFQIKKFVIQKDTNKNTRNGKKKTNRENTKNSF